MPSEHTHPEPQEYEPPTVVDLGALTELTQVARIKGLGSADTFGGPVS